MTGFHEGVLASFDLETTGVRVGEDRVVTACVAVIHPAQEPDVSAWLINPGVDIPEAATAVHGVSTEKARAEGRKPAEALDEVCQALADALNAGTPIVGCNVSFDLTLLDRDCRRHGVSPLSERVAEVAPVLDVFVIDKAVDRYRKGKRTLTDLCAHYGVRLDGAHTSDGDALAAARVLWRIGQRATSDVDTLAGLYADRRYPSEVARSIVRLSSMSVAELHAAQVCWYAEQSEGLAQWWRRKANEAEWQARSTTDEVERDTLLADAERLRADADGVTGAWPIQPFGGAR